VRTAAALSPWGRRRSCDYAADVGRLPARGRAFLVALAFVLVAPALALGLDAPACLLTVAVDMVAVSWVRAMGTFYRRTARVGSSASLAKIGVR
jgi:hypothetical protein